MPDDKTIRKVTLAKEVGGKIEYFYPKTSSDIVSCEYDGNAEIHTVEDAIGDLNRIVNGIAQITDFERSLQTKCNNFEQEITGGVENINQAYDTIKELSDYFYAHEDEFQQLSILVNLIKNQIESSNIEDNVNSLYDEFLNGDAESTAVMTKINNLNSQINSLRYMSTSIQSSISSYNNNLSTYNSRIDGEVNSSGLRSSAQSAINRINNASLELYNKVMGITNGSVLNLTYNTLKKISDRILEDNTLVDSIYNKFAEIDAIYGDSENGLLKDVNDLSERNSLATLEILEEDIGISFDGENNPVYNDEGNTLYGRAKAIMDLVDYLYDSIFDIDTGLLTQLQHPEGRFMIKSEVSSYINNKPTNSWEFIKTMIHRGAGPLLYPLGSEIVIDHPYFNKLIFEVVGYDVYGTEALDQSLLPSSGYEANVSQDVFDHTMTIALKEITSLKFQFDAAEALVYVQNALLIGDYSISLGDDQNTVYFSTVEIIPSGGQICINKSNDKITVYESATSTISSAIYNCYTSPISGKNYISLGRCGIDSNCNIYSRAINGNSNWSQSAIRLYLNGEAWRPSHKFDRPPSDNNIKNKPFYNSSMNNSEFGKFFNIVSRVAIQTLANDTYEVSDDNNGRSFTLQQPYYTLDKFYLASIDEMYGENRFKYYKNNPINKYTNIDDNGDPDYQVYKLRSNSSNMPDRTANVGASGGLTYTIAKTPGSLCIVCTI